MESQLRSIAQQPQSSKTSAYIDLLNSKVFKPTINFEYLSQFVQAIVQDSVGLLLTNNLLSELIRQINSQLQITSDLKRQALETILSQPDFCSRQNRFEDHVSQLRQTLASLLEDEEDWSGAARVLQAIPLNQTHRTVTDEFRLMIYIRIVRLLLEDQDATSAETYLNRASLLIPSTTDESTILAFKLSQARIFDARRRFEEASKKYHEISFTSNLAEDEREHCLSASLICAVLAPAGPNRSRLLTSLFRDERTAALPDHTILSKMFLGQIIRAAELVGFEARLQPHQLARLPSSSLPRPEEETFVGSANLKHSPETVFDRAVMQHNLLAASKIYNHVSLSGLGLLVGLTAAAVEAMARTMIQEGRLKASIDQVEGMVTFVRERQAEGDVVVSNVAAAAAGSSDDLATEHSLTGISATIRWDEAIRDTCQKVEAIYEHVLLSQNTISTST